MLKSRLVVSATAALAFVALACSGSSSSSVSAADACSQAADALCQKFDACSHVYVQIAYADVATCKTRALGNCTGNLAATGQSNTPARTAACATALSSISCDDLFAGKLPPDCNPTAGQVKTGSTCGDDSQCASTFCGNGTDVCASCAVAPSEGGACVNDKCPSGLVCAGNLCVRPGGNGDACSATKPCRTNLVCANGTCSAGGKGGDACDPSVKTGTPCSLTDGFFCNPTSSKCDAIKTAAAGEACGLVNGAGYLCNSTTYCKKATPAATSGTCVARASDGAGCSTDESQGAPCLTGAICSDGVCKLKDASTCK